MYNEIFIIKKEILREVKSSIEDNRILRIWCGNSEFYGYSEDIEEIEEACNKLNSKNTNKKVRFVVESIKPLELVNTDIVK